MVINSCPHALQVSTICVGLPARSLIPKKSAALQCKHFESVSVLLSDSRAPHRESWGENINIIFDSATLIITAAPVGKTKITQIHIMFSH
jgi:hypothetical protein